jgi:hypothetical protein
MYPIFEDYSDLSDPKEMIVGISSLHKVLTVKNEVAAAHKLLLDYDNFDPSRELRPDRDNYTITLEDVERDVERLQAKWRLGAAEIYQTNNGFHVVFVDDWMDGAEMVKIVLDSGACTGYKRKREREGKAILRISDKDGKCPQLIRVQFKRHVNPFSSIINMVKGIVNL